jgi:hypothetical protein
MLIVLRVHKAIPAECWSGFMFFSEVGAQVRFLVRI